jgi:hypothetical protein
MKPRWTLSTFFRDPYNNLVPVVSAYGHNYRVPMHPATDSGSALVEIWAGAHQLDAAKQDSRVVICPYLFDPSPLPDVVIQAYTPFGAKDGMSMGALLAALCEVEPIYGHTFL